MPFCPNCGKQTEPGENYCAGCGILLKPSDIPPPPPPGLREVPPAVVPAPEVPGEQVPPPGTPARDTGRHPAGHAAGRPRSGKSARQGSPVRKRPGCNCRCSGRPDRRRGLCHRHRGITGFRRHRTGSSGNTSADPSRNNGTGRHARPGTYGNHAPPHAGNDGRGPVRGDLRADLRQQQDVPVRREGHRPPYPDTPAALHQVQCHTGHGQRDQDQPDRRFRGLCHLPGPGRVVRGKGAHRCRERCSPLPGAPWSTAGALASAKATAGSPGRSS